MLFILSLSLARSLLIEDQNDDKHSLLPFSVGIHRLFYLSSFEATRNRKASDTELDFSAIDLARTSSVNCDVHVEI